MSTDDSSRTTSNNNMTIAVRVRPLLPKEIAIAEKENAPHPHCITVDHEHNTVIVEERRLTVDLRPYVETRGIFAMDYAFDESAKNTNIYVSTLRSQLINAIKNNERLACFVFGQTGSGKSFTMLGDQSQHGLFSLAVRDILGYGRGMELYFSFYELFNGKAYDLLNERAALLALEDGKQTVHLKGLSEFLIDDEDSFLELMHQGSQMRSQGSTHANENSSRSHAVALLNLTKKTSKGTIKVMSRFTFIDLAGSERGRDTLNTQNERHKEGAAINRSLLAVKECVRALHSGNQHVPFRGSKLTQVLRESLSGKCATVMIAMVSPFYKHVEDSVNALKYTSMLRQATTNASSNHVTPQVNTSLITNGGKEHQSGATSGNTSPRVGNNNNNNSLLSSPNSQQNTLILSSISNDTTNNNTNNNVHSSYNEEIECCSKCGYPLYAEDGIPHSCPKSSIRCPHCQMGVMKRNFEAHLAECPEVVVWCQFCRQEMKKKDIEKHENTVCPRSFAICTQCQQRIQPKSAMAQHMAENCLAAKWMCPFCKIVTSKRNADDHQTTCAARLVNCENCGFKVRSNHLKQHKRVCVGTRRLDEIMEQEVHSPKMLVPIGNVANNNSNQKQQYEFTKVVTTTVSPSSGNSIMVQHQQQQQQNLGVSPNSNHQDQQQQQKIVKGISKPPTLAHLKVATHPGLAALLENNNNNNNSSNPLQQKQQQQQSPQQNSNQKRKVQQEIDEFVSKLPRSLSPALTVDKNINNNNNNNNNQKTNNNNSKPVVNHIQKNRQNAASNKQQQQPQQAQTARIITTNNNITSTATVPALLDNIVNTNRKNQQSPLPIAPSSTISHTARTPQPATTTNTKAVTNQKNNNNNKNSRHSPSTPPQQIIHHVKNNNKDSNNNLNNNSNNPPPPALSPMHVSACQFCHEHFLDNVLQRHIEHECMSVKVPCPFADAGCKHLIERRNLASHLNENVGQHLVLLHSFTQHVEAENVTLKQRLEELEYSKRQHGSNSHSNNKKVDVEVASNSQQQQMMSSAQIAAALHQARLTKRNSFTENNNNISTESAQQQEQQQSSSDNNNNSNNPSSMIANNNGKPKLKSTRQQLQLNSSPSMTVEKKVSSQQQQHRQKLSIERVHTPNRNESFRYNNNHNNNDDEEETKHNNKYNNDDSAFDDDEEDDLDENSISGEIIHQPSSTTAFAPTVIKIHAIPGRRSTSPPPMGLNELLSDDDDNNNNNTSNENSLSPTKIVKNNSKKPSQVVQNNSRRPNPHEDGVFDDEEEEMNHSNTISNNNNHHKSNNYLVEKSKQLNNNNKLRTYHNVSSTSVRTTSSNGAINHSTRKYSKQPSEMMRLSADPPLLTVVVNQDNQKKESSVVMSASPPQIAKTNKNVVATNNVNNNNKVVSNKKK